MTTFHLPETVNLSLGYVENWSEGLSQEAFDDLHERLRQTLLMHFPPVVSDAWAEPFVLQSTDLADFRGEALESPDHGQLFIDMRQALSRAMTFWSENADCGCTYTLAAEVEKVCRLVNHEWYVGATYPVLVDGEPMALSAVSADGLTQATAQLQVQATWECKAMVEGGGHVEAHTHGRTAPRHQDAKEAGAL